MIVISLALCSTASADPATIGPLLAPQAANGQGNAVSCASSEACVVVSRAIGPRGNDEAVASRWDGSTWTTSALPVPAGTSISEASAVSCASATACVAGLHLSDGSTDGAGVATWDGSAWATIRLPAPSGASNTAILGVSCVSSTACMAVGMWTDGSNNTQPLAEHWDGSSWSILPLAVQTAGPNPLLNDVSCSAADACTAVGQDANSHAVVLRWDGTTWTQQAAIDAPLQSVSCPSQLSCTAVGGGTIEAWNGLTWAAQPPAAPANATLDLRGVSCSTDGSCEATGSTEGTPAQSVAELRTGVVWTLQQLDTPSSAGDSLMRVSCTAPSACVAAGSYIDPAGATELQAQRWDGSAWHAERPPTLEGAVTSLLQGIACSSVTACMAVGENRHDQTTLSERWDGVAWTVEPMPAVSGSTDPWLYAISCPTDRSCIAVGQIDAGNPSEPLVERWDGQAWHVDSLAAPSGAQSSALRSISCSAPDACTAVGDTTSAVGSTGAYSALVERWNGQAWTQQAITDSVMALTGVSCATSSDCIAVGDGTAEHWDGTSWRAAPTAQTNPPSAGLTSVACTAPDSCLGVGTTYGNSGRSAYSEIWDGRTWAPVPMPSPGGAGYTAPMQISCRTDAACEAVGFSSTSAGASQYTPFAEHWDGNSWMLDSAPYPLGAPQSGLDSVSCPVATLCESVGSSVGDASRVGLVLDSVAVPFEVRLSAPPPSPPTSGQPPAIIGTPQVGRTLQSEPGSWSGGTTGFTDQWQRCDSSGGQCTSIPDATGPDYVPTEGDVGMRLGLAVTAVNDGGTSAPATAAVTAPVMSGASSETGPPSVPTASASGGGTPTPSPATTGPASGPESAPANSSSSSAAAPFGASGDPPTAPTSGSARTRISALLLRALHHGLSRRRVLARDGDTIIVTAPTSGRLIVRWYEEVSRHRICIGSGRSSLRAGVRSELRVWLTGDGRRRLRTRRRATVIVVAHYAIARARPIVLSAPVGLRP